MAHHQGMSLLALAHLLLDRPMQRRFESDPLFQATLLLLQERVAARPPRCSRTPPSCRDRARPPAAPEAPMRVFTSPDTPTPEVQLLSNGRYHVMVTNAGGGYSRWKDLAVTRWREDGTCDNWGTFCYLRDVGERRVLVDRAPADAHGARRTTRRSSPRAAPSSAAATTTSRRTPRSSSRRRTTSSCAGSASPTASADAPDDRRHELRGGGARAAGRRRAAPGLQQPVRADRDLRQRQAILCTRRPRSHDEQPPWMFHLMAVHGVPTSARCPTRPTAAASSAADARSPLRTR